MAFFSNLPSELILKIVAYLEALHDIISLALVRRYLHHVIDITERRYYHRICLQSDLCYVRAYWLLLRMLREPRLRLYVREIEVYIWPTASGFAPIARLPETAPEDKNAYRELQPIIPFLNDAGVTDETGLKMLLSWIQMYEFVAQISTYVILQRPLLTPFSRPCRQGPPGLSAPAALESFAIAFMTLSPNLEKLKLCRLSTKSFLRSVLKNASDNAMRPLKNMNSLQNLREVHIGSKFLPETFETYLLNSLKLFQRYPNVEKLVVSCMKAPQREQRVLAPRSSNFRKVYIKSSCMTSRLLANIIKHFKTLNEFACSTGIKSPDELIDRGNFTALEPLQLKQALFDHKDTLRLLDLDLDSNVMDITRGVIRFGHKHELDECLQKLGSGVPVYLPGIIASLKQLAALTHLHIGVQSLLGHPKILTDFPAPAEFKLASILPPNLQFLSIRGYRSGSCAFHISKVSELIETKKSCLPSLKEVWGLEDLKYGVKVPHGKQQPPPWRI
ncbi:F-box domain containing protein [Coccidioides posadasii C735 delta SOWgp]|uniref:F-box domain containing protein n=1 Tax=Coccidioides posadasii (strain C735) TaxID=222929 RepID=C5PF88_COCP7|nr:F-box domain containing protein [Coccidioides posadasii C735 delta SOWgp]EER24668.1 F-box domain containing protein [Coccidioides posadasii C735 delta SOWgp]|eukprot:XP_003066813.1 F-box domain containing protein [Coccidioides posadasii C735 delta SOWgp]